MLETFRPMRPGKDPQTHFSWGTQQPSRRHTCGFLKRIHRTLQPSWCLPVIPGPDLCVEGSDVKQNAGFLQQQVLLADRNPGEGVIPI